MSRAKRIRQFHTAVCVCVCLPYHNSYITVHVQEDENRADEPIYTVLDVLNSTYMGSSDEVLRDTSSGTSADVTEAHVPFIGK